MPYTSSPNATPSSLTPHDATSFSLTPNDATPFSLTPNDAAPFSLTSPDAAENNWGFSTRQVRAGYNPTEHNHAVSVPIYQTTAYSLETAARADAMFAFEDEDPLYTRLSNPTVDVLERRVTALHKGAKASIALASGMAAVSCALLNVAGQGGHILTNYRLYGGTVDAFTNIYPELGIHMDVVSDADDILAYEHAITNNTKAIFVESITNPLVTVSDLEALANVAHKHGIPLIVDNTVATPYLLNPFKHGADVVVYSATKALSGHGNVIAGLVLESGNFNYNNGNFPQFTQTHWFLRDENDMPRNCLDLFPDAPFTGRLRAIHLNYLGAALSPFDAYLILLGIETLEQRVTKQVENASTLATWLHESPHATWVAYPTLTENRYKKLAQRYLTRGAGSIVSFGFGGTEEQKRRFLDNVKLFSYQANIGDARSLIINPAQTTHIELSNEARAETGLTPETIRLSAGLEDVNDLIYDLQQAFALALGNSHAPDDTNALGKGEESSNTKTPGDANAFSNGEVPDDPNALGSTNESNDTQTLYNALNTNNSSKADVTV
ncbi:MAG: aminotransferase class I/II-fold pyridoxal phosphate-dependent enzyme [Coriobacteriales bacterium]|jgi:O-acetylhomoserine (thiol)-lyase|nr:aminotransferase class I/II-fold pyridoxal phosphate-dependent enzyme [Coriobacteriales bacterium]